MENLTEVLEIEARALRAKADLIDLAIERHNEFTEAGNLDLAHMVLKSKLLELYFANDLSKMGLQRLLELR